jgi:hypothetical protein
MGLFKRYRTSPDANHNEIAGRRFDRWHCPLERRALGVLSQNCDIS